MADTGVPEADWAFAAVAAMSAAVSTFAMRAARECISRAYRLELSRAEGVGLNELWASLAELLQELLQSLRSPLQSILHIRTFRSIAVEGNAAEVVESGYVGLIQVFGKEFTNLVNPLVRSFRGW